jgi:hypothetical protein
MSTPSPFTRPTLNVIIADDEPGYQKSLEELIVAPIRTWSMLTTGQFLLAVHPVGNLQDFLAIARSRLDTGELVYATLDMGFMEKPDSKPGQESVTYGKRMLTWCLEETERNPEASRSFQFCVVSQRPEFLNPSADDGDEKDEDRKLRDKFRQRGVRLVDKRALIVPDQNLATRTAFAADIRDFILRQLKFATFPTRPGMPDGGHQAIWFDPRMPPARLLLKADALAVRKQGGLYLVFANTAGYEEDWFRLYCHLRRVSAQVKNFSLLDPNMLEEWTRPFFSPPATGQGALFISRINHARADAQELIIGSGLLDAAVRGDCSVFIQFPFFETALDYDTFRHQHETLVDNTEYEILAACMEKVYGHPNWKPGVGFFAEDHDHIIPFPDYETVLKREGILRTTIAYEAAQWAAAIELPEVPLDPEFAEFLAEYPWHDEALQLARLHGDIREAYEAFRKRYPAEPRPRYVTGEGLRKLTESRTAFDKEFGFGVRTRWLYRHLSASGPRDRTDEDGTAQDGALALQALEAIQDLFERLTRWRVLLDRLHPGYDEPGMGGFPSRDGLPPVPSEAKYLKRVLDFLVRVFDSPQELMRDVEDFRPNARSAKWRKMFPGRARKESQLMELFEGVQMVWPLEKLPLHWAISEYLQESDINYRVATDYKAVLEMNWDLKEEFDKLEGQRASLLKQLSERESQRTGALKAMLQLHAPPVATFLQQDDLTGSPADLNAILVAFFHFPAFMAVCEDYYRFEGKLCNRDLVQKVLDRPQFGDAINLIDGYLEALGRNALLDQSVLRKWHRGWASDGRQTQAIRVATNIGRELYRKFPARFGSGKDGSDPIAVVARKGPDGKAFPVREVLSFVNALRLELGKATTEADKEIWSAVGPESLNLLRQFVAATTGDCRIGLVGNGNVRLWQSTHTLTDPQPLAAQPEGQRPAEGELWACRCQDTTIVPLFKVDEVIRMRPADNVLFGYYNPKLWRPITYSPVADALAPGSLHPWLPSLDAWKKFPLIRTYLGN